MLRTKVTTIGGQQLLLTKWRIMMGMSPSASQRDCQLGILGQRVTRAKAKGMENTELVAKVTAKDAMEQMLGSLSGMHHLLQRQQSILRQKQSLDAVRVYVRFHGSMAVKVITCCTRMSFSQPHFDNSLPLLFSGAKDVVLEVRLEDVRGWHNLLEP
jgi:hypothetical protein